MKPTPLKQVSNTAKINHSNQFHAAINPCALALKKQQLGGTIPGYWIFWTVKGFQLPANQNRICIWLLLFPTCWPHGPPGPMYRKRNDARIIEAIVSLRSGYG
jgi:hypothetical protein